MNTNMPDWSLVDAYTFRQPERVFFNPYNNDEVWVTSFGNGMKVGNMLNDGIISFENTVDDLNIYPNPSRGFIYVTLTYMKELPFSIYNSAGIKVYSGCIDPGENIIELKNFPGGFYFFSDDKHIRKFILY